MRQWDHCSTVTTATPISRGEREGTETTLRRPGDMVDARRRPRLRQADRGVALSARVFVTTHLIAIRIAGDIDHGIHSLNNYFGS